MALAVKAMIFSLCACLSGLGSALKHTKYEPEPLHHRVLELAVGGWKRQQQWSPAVISSGTVSWLLPAVPPIHVLGAFSHKGLGFDVCLKRKGDAANPWLTAAHFPHGHRADWSHKTHTCREHLRLFPKSVCRDWSLPCTHYAAIGPSCFSFLLNSTCWLSSRNWAHLDNEVLLELMFWIWHFAKRCFHNAQGHSFLDSCLGTIVTINKTPKHQFTEVTSYQNRSCQFL